MTPRPDHRRPAAAFAVLFVVAMLVLGSGLRARAAVGTAWAAGDPVVPRVIRILLGPHAQRPSSSPSATAAHPPHRSPAVAASPGRLSPLATASGRRAAEHPVRRTRAVGGHRFAPARAAGHVRRAPSEAGRPGRSADRHAFEHPPHRAAAQLGRPWSAPAPHQAVGAGHGSAPGGHHARSRG